MPSKWIAISLLALSLGIGSGYFLALKYGAKPKAEDECEPLFYRHPMNPAVTSKTPTKDEMGMDYVPIYPEGCRKAPLEHAEPPHTLTIPLERLQEIGVRFEIAQKRPLTRTIRTVGRVEIDERRLANVNSKIEGWVDKLYVSAVGDRVRQGQVLFTLYSPQLVATQQEYLTAWRSVQELENSPFPQLAQGAKALLEATRSRFLLWDIPKHHIEELERTGKVAKTLPIHAPNAGTVIERKVLAGMYVKPGDPLYTIADLSSVWVIADIYEYELPLIQVGQTADVTLSYDPKTHFQARLDFIYPTLDPNTRTAKVRFELENPKEKLKPDMYANVELQVPLGMRLAVPKDAVLETGERKIAFLHHGGGKLEWRKVVTGLRAEDWVEVTSGLTEGEHVVTSATFLIDSESQLKAAVNGMKP